MAFKRLWKALCLTACGGVLLQLVGGCDSILASLVGDFVGRYVTEFVRSGFLS